MEREKIELPEPSIPPVGFSEVLIKRRSRRSFTGGGISLRELSALLFSAQGITGEKYGVKLRTAPSAGATYPVDIVVFASRVEGVRKGFYVYDPHKHSLLTLKRGDFSGELTRVAVGQDEIMDSSCVFVMLGVLERIIPKYGERSIRYIFLECGHISQNIYLMCEALGLGSVVMGAFYDDELLSLLGIKEKSEIITAYIHVVGRIK